ncbi:DUF397 domain-containing protein [Streptomyces pseudogriseolus]|uniref:DUF397 domain-containing protein n=2 Tax=Streptomyces pseudogriseolus TaxID=36817 RepID=UPI001CE2B6B1|nr:DUF397 domain-containing protein [Streptomyces pseudogriseolus]
MSTVRETRSGRAAKVKEAGGVLEVLQDEVDRAKLPRFFRNFAVIEAEVVSRFSYDPLLVPGLLQTEAYARAVFAGHCPPLSEEIVDQHTEARLSRQKLLARVPLAELSFIVSEEALRNPVDHAEVMRGQRQRLLEVSALRNVEVQVMPAGRDVSMEQVTVNMDGLHWFKSSYSGPGGGDCVEVAAGLDAVYVRDSKAAGGGPVLRVGRDGWAAFVALTAG